MSVRNYHYTLHILEERISHRSKLANMTVGGGGKIDHRYYELLTDEDAKLETEETVV